jgi:hypothetical protein
MLALLLAGAAVPARPAITDNRVPDAALIAQMEARIVMPQGAGPLESYDRAYTEAKVDGRDFVVGQLIDHRFTKMVAAEHGQPLPPPVQRLLMKDIIPAFDGGCMIVRLRYDVASGRAPEARCNPTGPH